MENNLTFSNFENGVIITSESYYQSNDIVWKPHPVFKRVF